MFTYVTAVTRLEGDKSVWGQHKPFSDAIGCNPVEILTFSEMVAKIQGELSTALAGTDVGRMLQLFKAAGVKVPEDGGSTLPRGPHVTTDQRRSSGCQCQPSSVGRVAGCDFDCPLADAKRVSWVQLQRNKSCPIWRIRSPRSNRTQFSMILELLHR